MRSFKRHLHTNAENLKYPHLGLRSYDLDSTYNLDSNLFHSKLEQSTYTLGIDKAHHFIGNRELGLWQSRHQGLGAGKSRGFLDNFADRSYVSADLVIDNKIIEGAQNSYTFFTKAMNAKDYDAVRMMMGEGLNSSFLGWIKLLEEHQLTFEIDLKKIDNIVPLGRTTLLDYSRLDEQDESVVYVSRPHITTLISEESREKDPKVTSSVWVEIMCQEVATIRDVDQKVIYQSPEFVSHIWKFGGHVGRGDENWSIRVEDMDNVVGENFVNIYDTEKVFLDPFAPRSAAWMISRIH